MDVWDVEKLKIGEKYWFTHFYKNEMSIHEVKIVNHDSYSSYETIDTDIISGTNRIDRRYLHPTYEKALRYSIDFLNKTMKEIDGDVIHMMKLRKNLNIQKNKFIGIKNAKRT